MDNRKSFMARLDPAKWLEFKRYLLDHGLSIQVWVENQVDKALAESQEQKGGNGK